MVQLKKTQVKIISVLIALVFVGSVVALALSQSNNSIASAAASSNVGVVDYQQFGSIKDITDIQTQMEKAAKDAQKEFEEKQQNDMMEPVRQKIEAAVKEVAEAKGITVVLNKEAVVYGGTDLTQDVIKKLSK